MPNHGDEFHRVLCYFLKVELPTLKIKLFLHFYIDIYFYII